MLMEVLVFLLTATSLSWRNAEAANMTGCKSELPYKVSATFQEKGDIFSPGYEEGEVYPNLLYCQYNIEAPPGYSVKLTFKDIDIDPYDKCGNDMMHVFDGPDKSSGLIGVYCGSEPPHPIISSVNAMHILFVSNYIIGRRGYHLQYEAIPTAEVCSGKLLCQNYKCVETSVRCDGKDDCGDGTDEEKCGLPIPSTECGLPSVAPIDTTNFGADRVIGGLEVREGSWPWQVDVQVKFYYPNGHKCGGILIHPEWVLTAMNCFRGHAYASDWRLHFGKHHKFKKDPYEQIRHVKRLIIYPGYTEEEILGKNVDFNHDIGLMKLSAPVEITDYVKVACLPSQGQVAPVGTTCIATGWGLTRGSGHSDVLKQVEMTIQPKSACPLSNETKLCLKNNKGFYGVCHGDGGGPLVCKSGDKWEVIGITSHGSGYETNLMSGLCSFAPSGTLFTRVAEKVTWINDMIKKFG